MYRRSHAARPHGNGPQSVWRTPAIAGVAMLAVVLGSAMARGIVEVRRGWQQRRAGGYAGYIAKLKAYIPANAVVMGQPTWFYGFSDQPYYSDRYFAWVSNSPQQEVRDLLGRSFEEALAKARVEYLIFDDQLHQRMLNRDRRTQRPAQGRSRGIPEREVCRSRCGERRILWIRGKEPRGHEDLQSAGAGASGPCRDAASKPARISPLKISFFVRRLGLRAPGGTPLLFLWSGAAAVAVGPGAGGVWLEGDVRGPGRTGIGAAGRNRRHGVRRYRPGPCAGGVAPISVRGAAGLVLLAWRVSPPGRRRGNCAAGRSRDHLRGRLRQRRGASQSPDDTPSLVAALRMGPDSNRQDPGSAPGPAQGARGEMAFEGRRRL